MAVKYVIRFSVGSALFEDVVTGKRHAEERYSTLSAHPGIEVKAFYPEKMPEESLLPEAVQTETQAPQNFLNDVLNQINAASSAATGTATSSVENMLQSADALIASVTPNGILSFVVTSATNAYTFVVDTISSLIDGAVNMWNDFVNQIKKIFSAVASALTDNLVQVLGTAFVSACGMLLYCAPVGILSFMGFILLFYCVIQLFITLLSIGVSFAAYYLSVGNPQKAYSFLW